MSKLAIHAINIEHSTPIINYVIDRLKTETDLTSDYNYFYFIDPEMAYQKNSFEEKSIASAICFKSNMKLEKASIALVLMRSIHNESHDFFSNPANNPTQKDWYEWLCEYTQRDRINVEISKYLIPFFELRRKSYDVEIYTLDNIWEVRHSKKL